MFVTFITDPKFIHLITGLSVNFVALTLPSLLVNETGLSVSRIWLVPSMVIPTVLDDKQTVRKTYRTVGNFNWPVCNCYFQAVKSYSGQQLQLPGTWNQEPLPVSTVKKWFETQHTRNANSDKSQTKLGQAAPKNTERQALLKDSFSFLRGHIRRKEVCKSSSFKSPLTGSSHSFSS